jgi:IS1 family transposase
MNKLSIEKRAQVISCLVEGMSIRSTVRITGAAKNTVAKLAVEMGNACSDYQDKVFHNLKCKQIQCDEIWSFCYAKEKNVPEDKSGQFGYGDIWTWVAIDADTKLIPSFCVGKRDAQTAKLFMDDLAGRLANRVQLTTDGHKVYLQAVDNAFGGDIDYAMLVKVYEATPNDEQRKYSPVECIGAEKKRISGNPDPKKISTSFVERQNLTMRMSMRRLTRLTNGFSKKVENHVAATSLYFMYYNFCRIHKTLRVTPAMEAGIADHVWSLEEIINLLNN